MLETFHAFIKHNQAQVGINWLNDNIDEHIISVNICDIFKAFIKHNKAQAGINWLNDNPKLISFCDFSTIPLILEVFSENNQGLAGVNWLNDNPELKAGLVWDAYPKISNTLMEHDQLQGAIEWLKSDPGSKFSPRYKTDFKSDCKALALEAAAEPFFKKVGLNFKSLDNLPLYWQLNRLFGSNHLLAISQSGLTSRLGVKPVIGIRSLLISTTTLGILSVAKFAIDTVASITYLLQSTINIGKQEVGKLFTTVNAMSFDLIAEQQHKSIITSMDNAIAQLTIPEQISTTNINPQIQIA